MNSIYNYLEYRDYLRDHFREEKSQKSFYSYRYISSKTGIDASYYVKILQKQKHLSEAKINKLMDFLKISGRRREYFKILASYNRSRNSTTAKELFNKLMKLKNSVGTQICNYNYFAQWYTIPMRELLNIYNFNGDYKKLAKQFSPPLKETEARKAIKTLKELNMISKDETGFYRPNDTHLTTGDQWSSAAISDFQKKMILMAGDAIEKLPKEERDISTVTVSTSKVCLDLISERLSQARREIMELIAAEEKVDGVYQINLQVFPLTKRKD